MNESEVKAIEDCYPSKMSEEVNEGHGASGAAEIP
jgi:hypothetical protein